MSYPNDPSSSGQPYQPYPGMPPGQPGGQPYQPYPGMPPGQPVGPRNKAPLVLIVVLSVLIIAGVGFFIWKFQNKDSKEPSAQPPPSPTAPASAPSPSVAQPQTTETVHAKVGDCIQVKKADDVNSDTNQISCDDPVAIYKVTEIIKGNGVCDAGEQFFQTFNKASKKVYKTICLRPNVKAGECINHQAANGDIERVACDDPKATHKILKVDETKADLAVCDSPDEAIVFAKRHVTYCVAPANKG